MVQRWIDGKLVWVVYKSDHEWVALKCPYRAGNKFDLFRTKLDAKLFVQRQS